MPAKIEIDIERLPASAFLDTNVMMRALGEQADERAPYCVAFWVAMLVERKRMYASAVTIAELLRKRPMTMPRTAGFAVLGFDERAAVVLGGKLPIDVIKEVALETGQSVSYLKFDALIIASAIRYNVDMLITLDDGAHKLAKRCGLRCARPEEFQQEPPKQLPLRVVEDDKEEVG